MSILIRVGDGERAGRAPSKVLTMIIRPPQQGQRAPRRRSFGVRVLEVTFRLSGRSLGRGEPLSDALDVAGSNRSGNRAVVANAVEAAGQHVQEKAADELGRVERHGPEPVSRAFDPVVLPFRKVTSAWSIAMSRELEMATPVSVAREVGKNGLWGPAQGSLGVDDPLGAARSREDGVEGALVGEQSEIAEEREAASPCAGRRGLRETGDERGAHRHAHRQEEAGLAGDPARPVRRQAAAGNDDVDMRMMGEGRAPGVEHGAVRSDARAQMLRVGGDGGQRLGCGLEQQIVDDGLVLERDRADRSRQREDDAG